MEGDILYWDEDHQQLVRTSLNTNIAYGCGKGASILLSLKLVRFLDMYTNKPPCLGGVRILIFCQWVDSSAQKQQGCLSVVMVSLSACQFSEVSRMLQKIPNNVYLPPESKTKHSFNHRWYQGHHFTTDHHPNLTTSTSP